MAQNDASRDLFVGDWDLRIAGADQDTKYYVYNRSASCQIVAICAIDHGNIMTMWAKWGTPIHVTM